MSDTGVRTELLADKDAVELAETRSRRKFSWARLGYGAVGVLVFLAIWDIAAIIKNDPAILPTVPATARTFWHYLFTDYPAVNGQTLLGHALTSTRRIVSGWAIGVVIGIVLGGAMASIRVVRFMIDPIIEFLRPLPPLAFLPLLIVWLGINDTPKITLIAIGVVPILTIATVTALDAVPDELVQASRSLGASPFYALATVRLRAAFPTIITGMRLAMGGAWTSIVAAELIASTSGLGYLINQAGQNLQMSLLVSGIVAIGIIGIVFDSLLRLLHRRTDPTSR
ncbi:ABC transporter permease [uncultured Jatrophihabitans sp.]|uniref:ABC transporter permease n=1 Tax=uncultured Jatrophihabitans sp. TaxID=1610747 RepID=UPI0035CA1553